MLRQVLSNIFGSAHKWLLFPSLALLLVISVACAGQAATPTATTRPAGATTPAATQATPASAAQATPTKAVPTPTPGPKDKVTIRMDWLFRPYHAPFFVALDKGWYDQNGLEVEIGEGRGSGTVAQLVGTGSITFGFVAGDAAVKMIATGVPVKTVAGIFRKGGMGILSLKEAPINKPEDLYGKAYGFVPGSSSDPILPGLFALNKADWSKVTVVNTDAVQKDVLLIQKKITATNCFDGSEVIRLRIDQKVETQCVTFGELGLNVPGHGIVVANSTLEKKPDMVRRFLDATVKAWEYSKTNTKEAVTIIRKYHPEVTEEYGVQWLPDIMNYLDSDATKGKPLGIMDEGEWQKTIDRLYEFEQIKTKPNVKDVYSNDYLPKR